MKTEGGKGWWVGVGVVAVFGVTAGLLAPQSTMEGAENASVAVLSDNDDVIVGEVPMDQLVRVPYHGPGPTYYPDGSAPCASAWTADDSDELLLYRTGPGYTTPQVFVYRPGRQVLVADDLATVAIAECPVTNVRVIVNGGVEGGEGTFRVAAALWDGCPNGGGQLIPGTEAVFSGISDNLEDFPILDFN